MCGRRGSALSLPAARPPPGRHPPRCPGTGRTIPEPGAPRAPRRCRAGRHRPHTCEVRARLTGKGIIPSPPSRGSAFLGRALFPEKRRGCPPPPRGGSVRGRAHRGAGRGGAHRTARRSTARPCGEGKGRAGVGQGGLAVTGEAPAACSEAGGSPRILTFVDILRPPQLPGCHPHGASKAPVFPSTLSSAAKNILTFFNISFLEEVLWI